MVRCESNKLDRYKRHLAQCSVAGVDIAVWLAESGFAVPYRDCKCEIVRDAADRAKASRIGIWAGEFEMPWEWRAQQSEQPVTPPTVNQATPRDSPACQIKGNISSKRGRNYHVPGGKWYDAANIDENRGERWFLRVGGECSGMAAGKTIGAWGRLDSPQPGRAAFRLLRNVGGKRCGQLRSGAAT